MQSRMPEGYSRWILGGVLITLVGYGATTLGLWREQGALGMWGWSDPYVFIIGLIALGLWRKRRLRAAGSVVLAAVMMEVHLAFALNLEQSWAPSGMMVPMLVSVAALWLGPRVAQWMGWLILFTIPAAIGISGYLGMTAGFAAPGFPYLVIVLATTVLVSNTLLITFMRWLAESLRRAEMEEARMVELIQAAPDGVVVVRGNEIIVEANAEAARILGAPIEELKGRRIDELLDWPDAFDFTGWLSASEATDELVPLLGGPTGIPLDVRSRRLPRHGGAADILLVMRDVSVRREAEEREKTLREQLLQAQKMEAIGLLAGGVAHDFNNLITVIGGYGAMLTRSSDPEARRYAPDIMAVQERGAAMVRQLLTFARRERVTPTVMDLSSCVLSAVPLLNRMVGQQVLLEVDAPEVCPVEADPGQMEQVLINLVVNARDAMPEGGRVWVSCRRRGDQVELRVRDEGEGMTPEVQARVFEPFYTTKGPDTGTGLGLSTVHGIVRRANGEVTVESTLGRGSTFVVLVPRSRAPLVEPAVPAMVEIDASMEGTSVLVAEDNDAVRSYLERLLRRAGFQVSLARSGDQALEMLMQASRPPDLFLCDVVMAGMTGPEVAELASKRWPGLRTLFMSGYLGVSAESEWFDTRSNLIIKPFGAGELLRRIEIVLEQAPQPVSPALRRAPSR